MKNLLILLTLFICNIGFAQSYEQIALDYYTNTILVKELKESNYKRKTYVQETVRQRDSVEYQRLVSDVMFYNPVTVDSIIFGDVGLLRKNVRQTVFEKIEGSDEKLIISEPLIRRKKVRFRKMKGIHYMVKHWWYSLFWIKYNLIVEPAIEFEDNIFVKITVEKKDTEYWDEYYLKINKTTKKVEDYEEVNWIQ